LPPPLRPKRRLCRFDPGVLDWPRSVPPVVGDRVGAHVVAPPLLKCAQAVIEVEIVVEEILVEGPIASYVELSGVGIDELPEAQS
jgi:hypothetical protein